MAYDREGGLEWSTAFWRSCSAQLPEGASGWRATVSKVLTSKVSIAITTIGEEGTRNANVLVKMAVASVRGITPLTQ